MVEKIIGYVLLAVGVVIILFSGVNMYRILLKKSSPVAFVTEDAFASMTQPKTQTIQGVEVELPPTSDLIGISPKTLAYTVNLTIHIFLLGFFVNIGYKIALVGTHLMRPIVVDLRTKGIAAVIDSKNKPVA